MSYVISTAAILFLRDRAWDQVRDRQIQYLVRRDKSTKSTRGKAGASVHRQAERLTEKSRHLRAKQL